MSELTEKQKIEKAIIDAQESLKTTTDTGERVEIRKGMSTNFSRLLQLESYQSQAAAAPVGN